jgi:hypothetical protein
MKPSRKARPQEEVEDVRTGLGVQALKQAFRDNLFYIQGRHPRTATRNDLYMAVAHNPGDESRIQRLSLIDERGERAVRMANLNRGKENGYGEKNIKGVSKASNRTRTGDGCDDHPECTGGAGGECERD